MEIVFKPIMRLTMSLRGKKMHDIEGLINTLYDTDETVVMVNCGEIQYNTTMSMGNSITHAALKLHRRISFHTIKGDDKNIIVFKM